MITISSHTVRSQDCIIIVNDGAIECQACPYSYYAYAVRALFAVADQMYYKRTSRLREASKTASELMRWNIARSENLEKVRPRPPNGEGSLLTHVAAGE